MEHSNIIQVHHPSGMLYEAFCQFTKGHADASFFQSDAFFRMVCKWDHAEATLLLSLARNPALERTPAPGAAGKQPKPVEEESLFPGGVFLFRGQKTPDPENDLSSDPDPQSANTQHPTSNSQPPIANTQHPTSNSQYPIPKSQPPIANSQHPTSNPGDIPGVGRVVGSLLAISFSGKTGWARRMRRQTVVFGGPLLGGGTRLDQETRLRNLLSALDRDVRRRSLSVHLYGFRYWGKLSPIFSELGYSDGGKLSALSAWKSLWNAAMEANRTHARVAETEASPGSPDLDLAHLEKQLETCFARHGALHKTYRPILSFLLKGLGPGR